MIDPNLYATAKAAQTVTLVALDSFRYQASFQQFDPNTGRPVNPLVQEGVTSESQTALTNAQQEMTNLATLVTNLQGLMTDLAATPPPSK